MKCPNKSHPDFKLLSAEIGVAQAILAFHRNGEVIPTIEQARELLKVKSVEKQVETDNINEEHTKEIEDTLKAFCKNNNIPITVVDSITTRLGDNAKESVSIKQVEGVLTAAIELAHDNSTNMTTVLSEAVSHVYLEALGWDNKEVKELYDSIEDTDIFNEVYRDYYKEYNGDMDKIKREAVGKELSNHIMNKRVNNESLIQRIINLAKSLFKRADYKSYKDKIEAIYNKHANIIKNSNKVVSNYKSTEEQVFYNKKPNSSTVFDANVQVIKDNTIRKDGKYIINGVEYIGYSKAKTAAGLGSEVDMNNQEAVDRGSDLGNAIHNIAESVAGEKGKAKTTFNMSVQAEKSIISEIKKAAGGREIRTNVVVYDKESKVMGVMDIVFINSDGTITPVEIKSREKGKIGYKNAYRDKNGRLMASKQEEYFTQLGAYKYMTENSLGVMTTDPLILLFQPITKDKEIEYAPLVSKDIAAVDSTSVINRLEKIFKNFNKAKYKTGVHNTSGISKTNQKLNDILNDKIRIINNRIYELKNQDIISQSKKKEDIEKNKQIRAEKIDDLEKLLRQVTDELALNNDISALITLLNKAGKPEGDIAIAKQQIDKIINNQETSSAQKLYQLRYVESNIMMYKGLGDFVGDIVNDENFASQQVERVDKDNIVAAADRVEAEVRAITKGLNKKTSEYLAETYVDVAGDNPQFTINNILSAPNEMGVLEYYTNILDKSNDPLLAYSAKLFKEQALFPIQKESEEFAEKSEEIAKEVLAASTDKKKAFDFMVEVIKDKAGKIVPSGYIVREGTPEFYKEFADLVVAYRQAYRQNEIVSSKENKEKKALAKEALIRFQLNNCVDVSEKVSYQPTVLHGSPKIKSMQWLAIQNNPIQKKYYEFYKESKRLADERIPDRFRDVNKLPAYTKELTETIRKQGLGEAWKYATKYMKSAIGYMDAEDSEGEEESIIDVYGNVVNRIHLTGLRRFKDATKMSLDIPNVLNTYYHMSLNYQYKTNIKHILETTKQELKNRAIPSSNVYGDTKRDTSGKVDYKKGENRNYDRFVAWFDSVFLEKPNEPIVGGVEIKDKKIIIDNVVKTAMSLDSFTVMGLNVFQFFNNLFVGTAQNFIEAAGGQNLTVKDATSAMYEYWRNIKKGGKLDLLNKVYKFTTNTNENFIQNQNKVTKWVSKLAYFFQETSEHMVQSQAFIAALKKEKIKDNNGNEISVWDAYQVKDGVLVFNADKSQINETALRLKISDIKSTLQGRYSPEDANVMQTNLVGQMMLQYRKWIMPGIEERFSGERFNVMRGNYTKGRYRSYISFLKEIRRMKYNAIGGWQNMSDLDKINMRKNAMELGLLVLSCIAYSLITLSQDDDDELKRNRALNFARYQADRMTSDLSFYFGFGTAAILRTPAATITTIESCYNFFSELASYVFEDEEEYLMQKGKYKGQVKAGVYLKKKMPIVRVFERVDNLNQPLDFWKQ